MDETENRIEWEDTAVFIEHVDINDSGSTIELLPPHKIDDILRRLGPTKYRAKGSCFNKYLEARIPGTGQWILESPRYREWHDKEENGLLWIKGIPGSGKSIHAATVIEQLKQENTPVLYFFFVQTLDANQQLKLAVNDWIAQILRYSTHAQKKLEKEISKFRDLSWEQRWEYLQFGLRQVAKAYLVIDGIDELDQTESKRLLERLVELRRYHPIACYKLSKHHILQPPFYNIW
ncbi:hypothetical protein VHEMI05923 [[Torrubiella] hemipterigena]|uniref:Nephrocystin 3-like N-terminal domain-containing protein n=1 Tax=[Torrubiella] hemipterigena TaxID=1531966 RepID=A0A0A1T5N6_9HYPO|nr:hypothetical protein VHEMI05923 [[Torrubiella] hemipterigena]